MEYNNELLKEKNYLHETQEFIEKNLEKEQAFVLGEKGKIIDARRDMWENVSFTGGFNNVAEANQILESIQTQAASYDATYQRIEQYQKALSSPYFARVDFAEDGNPIAEPIYIGLFTLMDDDSYKAYVYDWRAPICSIFYQYELGKVQYKAPSGIINGEVTLKRQYDIKDGQLQYFFDADVNIQDEILRTALSQNTSPKMRAIVETIQRQQDEIIRDTENELVIVQGVAGSGKTAVALHRVAFLLYQGASQRLFANNIVILSPNTLFGSYIANVLPELGEKNIADYTFETLFSQNYPGWQGKISNRNVLLEELVSSKEIERTFLQNTVSFLSSKNFVEILERYINYVTTCEIKFEDIYFNGKVLLTREKQKAFVLHANKKTPLRVTLQLLEKRIWQEVHVERKKRMEKFIAFFRPKLQHQYDYKAYARLISIKESIRLKHHLQKIFNLDIYDLYTNLLNEKGLFQKLSEGITVPENLQDVLQYVYKRLNKRLLSYENILPLFYLSLRIYGKATPSTIRQVLVDEAQDYYPIHYYILKMLFPDARYTIMGDLNQTIEKQADFSVNDDIKSILEKGTSFTVTMKKGFRCSSEINQYSSQFLDDPSVLEPFERHEEAPKEIKCNSEEMLIEEVVKTIKDYQNEGLESIGIICKSFKEAVAFESQIKKMYPNLAIKLLNTDKRELFSGVMLMPVYMAKGFEFDGAIVIHTDDNSYSSPYDKKLLYIASTRALHRLTFLYSKKKSRFLTGLPLESEQK